MLQNVAEMKFFSSNNLYPCIKNELNICYIQIYEGSNFSPGFSVPYMLGYSQASYCYTPTSSMNGNADPQRNGVREECAAQIRATFD